MAEIVTLTIRVSTLGNETIRIIDPVLSGLEVAGTRETSQVSLQGGEPARLTTRELRLRAVRAGAATIGPVRVRQGDRVGESTALTVQVAGGSSVVAAGLEDRVRALLERLEPPERVEDVGLSVTAVQDSVIQGDQVDLVVTAWFPRDIRTRLSAPPTLSPPEIQGGWLYDQNAPSGIAASRLIDGRWYDLFVNHQIAYPLTERRLTVGAATVSYSLPLTYSFLSRELRHEVQSEAFAVTVLPLPKAGMPENFDGAVAADLSVQLAVRPRDVAVGDAVTVSVTVEGRGNVALWPAPHIRWPEDVRVYPGAVSTDVTPRGGWVAGVKRFTYVVISDSVGVARLPAVAYPYFDLDRRDYAVARAAPAELLVRASAGAPSRASPPGLKVVAAPKAVDRLVARMPAAAWIAITIVPPLLVGAVRGRGRWRRNKRPVAEQPEMRDALDRLDREFRRVLARLVPEGGLREGDGLADALRAAGVEAPVAEHAARVRDRLRQAVYGEGGSTDPDELGAEVQEVLRVLPGGSVTDYWRHRAAGALILALVCGLPAVAGAQALSPESMYEAGAYRSAVDSFAARAAHAPTVAAHWYNLGNALYRLGETGRAQVAWIRASRLAPRDPAIRRALELAPAPDRVSARALWIAPVTVPEAMVIAAVAWMLCWLLVLARFRPSGTVPVFVLAVVAAGYGVYVDRHYARPVAVVVGDETPLRKAPYGSAPASGQLVTGAAVVIAQTDGAWILVARGRERGWLIRREVVRL